MSAADTCRSNGWGPGTRLAGDSRHVLTVIEITAVGERSILAKVISQNGRTELSRSESTWVLTDRDWKEVAA